MPRIRQNEEQYAAEDFRKEVRSRQGYYGLMSVRSLAAEMQMSHTTLNPKINDPMKLGVLDLRKLIRTIHPDIGVVLSLLGYSRQEIKKFKEDNHESRTM